jgi:formate dehydrogenase maturation protein FdhE
MTNLALLLVQMAALQAHMDAVAQAIREELGVPDGPVPGSCPQCGAAAEKVEDASTIGQKASRCTVCGAEWDR